MKTSLVTSRVNGLSEGDRNDQNNECVMMKAILSKPRGPIVVLDDVTLYYIQHINLYVMLKSSTIASLFISHN